MKFLTVSLIVSLAASQATNSTAVNNTSFNSTDTTIQINDPIVVDCMQLSKKEVDRLNYGPNYRIKLKPNQICTFESSNTVYVSWDDFWSPFLSVKTENYYPPSDQYPSDWNNRTQPCELAYDDLAYESGEVLYTERSSWPNADPRICKHTFKITNDAAAYSDAEVTIYTQLSAIKLTVSLFALLALFF